jgi:hypothetical protein
MPRTRREPKQDKDTNGLTPHDLEELDRASPEQLREIQARAGREMEESKLAEAEDPELAPLVLKVKELQKPYRDDQKRARKLHKEAYKRLRNSGQASQ